MQLAIRSSPQRSRIWLSRSKTLQCSNLSTGNHPFRFISSRQPPETKLAFQSRWNLIQVQGVKRGGYRVPGSDKVVILFSYVFFQVANPNEKPLMANGWLVGTWTAQGIFCLVSCIVVENCVLSMCGGSASLMETCMQMGRSCIMFECNGFFFSVVILLF